MSELNKRDEALSKETVSSDKAQKKAKTPAKKDKKPNRLVRWLKDMKGEMKKITWPSGKDTFRNVLIVIVCVIVLLIFVCILQTIGSFLAKKSTNRKIFQKRR